MLRKLLQRVKDYFAARELNRQIANEELAVAFQHIPQVIQEAHETYKLGDYTITVMSSKEELDRRMMLTAANKSKKLSDMHNKAVDTAYNNLVKVADE